MQPCQFYVLFEGHVVLFFQSAISSLIKKKIPRQKLCGSQLESIVRENLELTEAPLHVLTGNPFYPYWLCFMRLFEIAL